VEAQTRLPELSENPEVIEAPEGQIVLKDDRSFRARVLQIAALKARGLNLKQIGEELGLTHGTIRDIVYKASKGGLIKYDDPFEHFEDSIVPKVVDGIEYWVDQKDKKMIIEAAKGAGIFKAHQAIKIESEAPQTILALKIEMPPGTEAPRVITGRVVGKPRRALKAAEDA
jgi:transposase